MITQRQEKLLNTIIEEYIDSAQPVSSQLLEKKYDFGICPATIRIEMQKLTEEGFISQPYTSAGRVPTDKGYRFFADKILEEQFNGWEKYFEIDWQNIQKITKFLAKESSNLALGYLPDFKILWKDGWSQIFHEPEFSETGFVGRFAEILDDFEENIEEALSSETCLPAGKVKVYIGKDNPFSKIQDFSIITTGVFTILGPKRMDYNKNIELLKSTKKWQKKI